MFMCSSCYACSVLYIVFIVPAGTLRLPWLRFLRAFSSVVRRMPGYNSQRRGTTRTLPKFSVVLCIVCFVLFYVLFALCCSMYCLLVNVHCTTATGCQPTCSSQIYLIISYHIIYHHITSYHVMSCHIIYHIISYHIIYQFFPHWIFSEYV